MGFASATGATPIAGRFTPGTFTNQIRAAFREPRLLVVTDPRTDHQPVREASYVNTPAISDAPAEDWNEPAAPAAPAAGIATGFGAPTPAAPVTDDWNTPVGNWAGDSAADTENWGGASAENWG